MTTTRLSDPTAPPVSHHPAAAGRSPRARRISCDDCTQQHTTACDDCVVTYICSRATGDAVVIDLAAERTLRMLSGAGLVPTLRHSTVQ